MRRACIVGHPVAHSRSPLIHGHWLARHGIAGSYGREDVLPGDLGDFMGRMRGLGYVGCNVTVPHKETVLRLVARADDTARAVGAANTIWFEGDTMIAGNTDVHGFLANLDERAPGWDKAGDAVLILGAGGAARAAVFGLIGRGFGRIMVSNRSAERALALRQAFGPRVEPVAWPPVADDLRAARLLVNTTSLGMAGQPPLDIPLDALAPRAVVCDIVYVPLETPLLEAARRRGHRVVDGLGMLLHQAVPGFARWFGVEPKVTPEMRALVEADVRGKAPAIT